MKLASEFCEELDYDVTLLSWDDIVDIIEKRDAEWKMLVDNIHNESVKKSHAITRAISILRTYDFNG